MKQSIFLILHNIRSLYNIGSIFRCADAFGVEKIYLTGYSAYPVNRQMEKIAKTSLGAEKSVPWEYHKQAVRLIKKLRKNGIFIVALEKDVKKRKSISLEKFNPRHPFALVVGNEVSGVDKKILSLCDHIVYISQRGMKESLNVSVATAIALYESRRNKID